MAAHFLVLRPSRGVHHFSAGRRHDFDDRADDRTTAGIQIFCWLATLWDGRLVFKTPLLFVIGFFFTFVIGGLTGVMVASVPFDSQVHDTYFVVAHFHYVLVGGAVFPLMGAVYYWYPKIIGRMMSERLGRWVFWLVFVGF